MIVLLPRPLDQRNVAGVQKTHRRHQPPTPGPLPADAPNFGDGLNYLHGLTPDVLRIACCVPRCIRDPPCLRVPRDSPCHRVIRVIPVPIPRTNRHTASFSGTGTPSRRPSLTITPLMLSISVGRPCSMSWQHRRMVRRTDPADVLGVRQWVSQRQGDAARPGHSRGFGDKIGQQTPAFGGGQQLAVGNPPQRREGVDRRIHHAFAPHLALDRVAGARAQPHGGQKIAQHVHPLRHHRRRADDVGQLRRVPRLPRPQQRGAGVVDAHRCALRSDRSRQLRAVVEAVLERHRQAIRPQHPSRPGGSTLGLVALHQQQRAVNRGNLGGIGCRLDTDLPHAAVALGDPNPVALHRGDAFGPGPQHPDLGPRRQVRREDAAECSGAQNGNTHDLAPVTRKRVNRELTPHKPAAGRCKHGYLIYLSHMTSVSSVLIRVPRSTSHSASSIAKLCSASGKRRAATSSR